MRPTFRLALLGLVLTCATAHAAGLRGYTAQYVVSRNGSVLGEATIALKPAPGGWTFTSKTRGTSGLARLAALDVDEASEVRDDGTTIESRTYRYRQTSIVKSRERSLDVDPGSRTIVAVDKKRTQSYAYVPGVLDRQSVTLGIAHELAAGKRGTLVFHVADSNDVSDERYQTGKEQVVSVPAGAIRAINVTRLRDPGSDRITTSWYGLDNGFVPVRILQVEKEDETFEMRLVSLKH